MIFEKSHELIHYYWMERVRGAENDHSLLRAYVGQGEFETNHGGDVGVDVGVAGVALQPIANGPGRQRGVPPIGFDQGGRLVFAKKGNSFCFSNSDSEMDREVLLETPEIFDREFSMNAQKSIPPQLEPNLDITNIELFISRVKLYASKPYGCFRTKFRHHRLPTSGSIIQQHCLNEQTNGTYSRIVAG